MANLHPQAGAQPEATQRGAPREASAAAETPLAGLTFFNPRAAEDAAALTEPLTRLGAAVIERPAIAFAPPASWEAFDQRLAELSARDWIVFTSATAVRSTVSRLQALGQTAARLKAAKLAAVGEGTARALAANDLPVELAPPPEEFQAEGLLRVLRERLRPGDRVWLPRAAEGRETLAEGLREAGCDVQATPVYRTVMPAGGLGTALEPLRAARVDWLVFTSPSTVRNFLAMAAEAGLTPKFFVTGGTSPRVACLGRVAAQAATEAGLAVSVTPRRQDIPGLVAAIVDAVTGRHPR